MYIYGYESIHMYIYLYIVTHIYIHIFISIHICMYTHTHTHTYTYMNKYNFMHVVSYELILRPCQTLSVHIPHIFASWCQDTYKFRHMVTCRLIQRQFPTCQPHCAHISHTFGSRWIFQTFWHMYVIHRLSRCIRLLWVNTPVGVLRTWDLIHQSAYNKCLMHDYYVSDAALHQTLISQYSSRCVMYMGSNTPVSV